MVVFELVSLLQVTWHCTYSALLGRGCTVFRLLLCTKAGIEDGHSLRMCYR